VLQGVFWWRDLPLAKRQDKSFAANLAVAFKFTVERVQGQNEDFSRLEAKSSGFLTLVSAALVAEVGLFVVWRSEKWFTGAIVALVLLSLVLVVGSIVALVVCLSIRRWYSTPKWSDFLDSTNLHDVPEQYVLDRLTKVRAAVERNDNMLDAKAAWFQLSLYLYAVGIFLFLLPIAIRLSAGLR
jgi:FtsH-binding integral membrane protein